LDDNLVLTGAFSTNTQHDAECAGLITGSSTYRSIIEQR
jgi:hypothetical protein